MITLSTRENLAATHIAFIDSRTRHTASCLRRVVGIVFSLLIWCTVMAPALLSAQDIRNPQSAVDSQARTDLRVDPITHALQFQIPLGQYGGRGGTSLPVTLNYSSKLWNIKYMNTTKCSDDPGSLYRAEYAKSSAAGWTSSLDWFTWPEDITLELYDGYSTRPANSGTLLHKIARIHVTLPDGSRHELRKDDDFHPYNETITGRFYAVDGSRLSYDTTTNTLYLPDGSRYITTTDPNNGTTKTYIDRNGNQLSFSYTTHLWTDTLGRTIGLPPLNTSTETEYTYTVPGVGGTPLSYTLRWRHLSTAGVINEQEIDKTLRYLGDHTTNCQTGTDYSGLFHSAEADYNGIQKSSVFDPVVLSQIVLPTGQSYTFKYNIYGEITKVIYPTGGYERFGFGAAPLLSAEDGVGLYSQANRGVTDAWISPDGTSTSEAHWGYNGFSTIAPNGSHTDRSVITNTYDWSSYGFEDPRLGMVYDERVYSPGGQMLRRKLADYAVDGQVVQLGGYYAYKQRNPRLAKEVNILLDTGGNALASTTTYQYDSDLNLTSTSRYDFVSVPQATAQTAAISSFTLPVGTLPLRTEETDYLTTNQAYRDRNLLSLPTATRVKDGNGNIVAQAQMFYDETPLTAYSGVTNWSDPSTTARGNLTRTRRWVNPSGTWIETRGEYDQCGNPIKSIDAYGKESQVEYAASYAYAYPTHTISAVPDASGVYGSNTSLETWTTYDASTGLVTATTDANNQTTSFQYNDPLNRLKLVTRPGDTAPGGGGHTAYDYGDTPGNIYVCTTTALDASRSIESYQFFDNLGRASRSFLNEGGSPIVFTTSDTQYDVMGRVWRVSNPYRTSGGGDAVNPTNRWTTTLYDTLGRALTVTTPDGAVVTSSYSGQYVTVTDQSGKSRRSQTDALGRLDNVVEDPFGTPLTTNYKYDVLGNLRQVIQGTQNRFFMYDSLSRLIRAKNPEQGALTADTDFPAKTDATSGTSNSDWSLAYNYDANGNLVKRKDARNVTTSYGYDALNRNTTVRYSDGTKDIDRHYDGAINGRGRFYYFNYDPNNNARFDSILAIDDYDGMGRIKTYRQYFLTNGVPSQAYTVKRTYDLAGHVATQTYPSGHTVTYAYDAAGRTSGMTGNIGDGVARTYAANIAYAESGGMSQEQFGTQTPLYHKLHYNVRGQLFDIRLSTSSLQTNEWDWNRGALVNYYSANYEWGGNPGATGSGADNNGNLLRSQHFVPADDAISAYTYTQDTYQYDALNRVASMSEDNGTNTAASPTSGAQGYDYDRWGNQTISQLPARTWGAMPRPQFDGGEMASTNRLYAPGDTALQMSQRRMQYDASGNLTFDSYTGHGPRGYDAENRMTSAQDNLDLNDSYTYDADGHRIKRKIGGTETWQVYGMDGELLAEYPAGNAPFAATKEYGYRAGELLVTVSSGDDARARRFVQNLYYGALHRDPLATELQSQTDALTQAGVQGQAQLQTVAAQMARGLFTSTAYETNPARTDAQYVADLYNTYLQRAADTGGLNYWASQAASSRANVCNAFEASSEFQTLVATLYGTSVSDNQRTEQYVNNFYLGAYGSTATTELQPERDMLNAAAAQDVSHVQAQAEAMGRRLFASQVTDTTITDTQYVTNLYEGFLQRGADDGGLNFWAGQAAGGAQHRQNVLDAFATSGAARALAATLYREVNWLVSDHLSTPRMIVDKSGLLSGVKRHDYLPFGEEVGAGVGGRITAQGYGQVDGNRKKWAQLERDDETGLDYAQARYYSSQMGRFTSPDPFMGSGKMILPQSWNRYTYVLNNPLILADPTGLIWGYQQYEKNGKQLWRFRWFDGKTVGKGYTAFTPDKNGSVFGTPDGGAVRIYRSGNFESYSAPKMTVTGQGNLNAAAGMADGAIPFGRRLREAVLGGGGGVETDSPEYKNASAISDGAQQGILLLSGIGEAELSEEAIGLTKQLASESQAADVVAGQGTAIIGAGTKKVLTDAPRLAAEYGGNAAEWQKVTSSAYKAGDGAVIEVHAYQNIKTGQVVELKSVSSSFAARH